MPLKARKPRRRREAVPQVTITITEVDTLPPHQQAAWDWFAAHVRATIARHRHAQEVPDADAR